MKALIDTESAIETMASMLDVMGELTRIVAINRAMLVLMPNPWPEAAEIIREYDLVLQRAATWMGEADVQEIIHEAEHGVRTSRAIRTARPSITQTA